MGIARGEGTVWQRVTRIFLDREEQFRYRQIEAPSEKMSVTY